MFATLIRNRFCQRHRHDRSYPDWTIQTRFLRFCLQPSFGLQEKIYEKARQERGAPPHQRSASLSLLSDLFQQLVDADALLSERTLQRFPLRLLRFPGLARPCKCGLALLSELLRREPGGLARRLPLLAANQPFPLSARLCERFCCAGRTPAGASSRVRVGLNC